MYARGSNAGLSKFEEVEQEEDEERIERLLQVKPANDPMRNGTGPQDIARLVMGW